MIVMYFSLKKENTQMAENSRKNEFFERESIAMIAITTSSSINVKDLTLVFICFPPWSIIDFSAMLFLLLL